MNKNFRLVVATLSLVVVLSFYKISLQSTVKVNQGAVVESFVDNIKKEFEHILEIVKQKAASLLTIPKQLKNSLMKSKYEDKEILILTDLGDGIKFDWGKGGHGTLEAYKSVQGELVLKAIPEVWASALTDGLKKSPIGKLITATPAQSAFFRILLLIKDRASKNISVGDYILEQALLMYRFTITPGFNSITAIASDVALPIKLLLENAKISGKSALAALDEQYSKIQKFLSREFSKTYKDGLIVDNPKYKPNGSKISDAQARGVVYALTLKSYIFYTQLKDSYEETPKGKDALAKKKRGGGISEYNSGLPGFGELKVFIATELARVLQRMENTVYKDTLKTIFDPLLQVMGLSFDSLLSSVADSPAEPMPSIPVEEPTFASNFEEIDVDSF